MRSFAQAPDGADRFPLPCDGLYTPTLPPLASVTMPSFRWQSQAKELQDRLGTEPLRGIAEEREHQQMLAAAEGGADSGVGVTPAVSGCSPA